MACIRSNKDKNRNDSNEDLYGVVCPVDSHKTIVQVGADYVNIFDDGDKVFLYICT